MDWQNILYSALSVIVTGLITWGMERVIAFLNTKIANVKALSYLTDAVNIVGNVVKATYQTYVKNLRDNNKFNTEAQKIALHTAVTQAKNQMSKELKSYITANFGDLTNWITTQIEAELYDLKNKQKGG